MLTRILKLELAGLAILILGVAAAVLSNLADPDYFWHLRTGQWIVENGRIPQTDPFLWSQTTTAWVLHEWLSDIILYKVVSWGGEPLLSVLIGVVFALTLAVIARCAGAYVPTTFALVLTCFAAAGIMPWLAGRPQFVTYLIFSVFLWALVAHHDRGRTIGLWCLPFLMLFWTNAHGAYLIGLVLIGATASVVVVEQLWKTELRTWRRAFWSAAPLWWCLLACLVAACINPYDVRHLLYPFKVMSLWILPRIAEWQPSVFGQLGSLAFFTIVSLWLVTQIFRQNRPNLFDLALPSLFILLGLMQKRHTPLAAIVLAVFIARNAMEVWQPMKARVLQRLNGIKVGRAGTPLGSGQYVMNWFLVVVVAAVGAVLLQAKPAKQLASANAVVGIAVIDYLAKNQLAGPIFNEYEFGGYLTWKLWPRQSAFIDGRSDMYSDQFSKDFHAMALGEPRWKELVDQYRFGVVVVSRATPLRQLLIADGSFTEVFSDGSNSVLTRVDRR
jgi:hypothetical protein